MLGPEVLRTLPKLLTGNFDRTSDVQWRSIGIDRAAIVSLLDGYSSSIVRLLTSGAQLSVWPAVPTGALQRLIEGWYWVATKLDFCLTFLFLILEGELKSSLRTTQFVLATGKISLKAYDAHLAVICREPPHLEGYFYQLLREQRLWLGQAPPPVAPATTTKFSPITVVGEPVSQSIIRERR
jgi:hypothetical protein